MHLENKVVIVLGGAGLLGEYFCTNIAKNGGIPVVADINSKKGSEIANSISDVYGCDSYFQNVDITSIESLKELFANANSRYKKIDAIVNNAYPRNKSYGDHFFDVTYKNFCENVNANLGGAFLVMQQAASFFIGQNSGNIINISSIYGVTAPKFEIYTGTSMTVPVEYAAIKSALIHMSRYLAKYLKGKNIRVNTISPGGIYQKQDESFVRNYNNLCINKGILNQEDIVGTLIYLLSDSSAHVNGQNIIVDDGFTL